MSANTNSFCVEKVIGLREQWIIKMQVTLKLGTEVLVPKQGVRPGVYIHETIVTM